MLTGSLESLGEGVLDGFRLFITFKSVKTLFAMTHNPTLDLDHHDAKSGEVSGLLPLSSSP